MDEFLQANHEKRQYLPSKRSYIVAESSIFSLHQTQRSFTSRKDHWRFKGKTSYSQIKIYCEKNIHDTFFILQRANSSRFKQSRINTISSLQINSCWLNIRKSWCWRSMLSHTISYSPPSNQENSLSFQDSLENCWAPQHFTQKTIFEHNRININRKSRRYQDPSQSRYLQTSI